MYEKQKLPLKKVVLVGIIFVPITVAAITHGDVFLMESEFSMNKLLFNLSWFTIIYIIFHKKMLKSD
jgi:hypothetical protein